MSGSINKVILIGNLCADPEIRQTRNGESKVANIRIATNETWRDKDGDKKERTEYHRVSIFNEGLCRVAEQYLRKGSKVYLEGQLQTREWDDQSGQKRYSTEIVLSGYSCAMMMMDGKPDKNATQRADTGRTDAIRQQADADYDRYGPASGSPQRPLDAMDDEIPF